MSRQFDRMYAQTGRPSIAPEKLLRTLLLQVLYTVRSERLLMEQLDYNLLFRWFVGLNMDHPARYSNSVAKQVLNVHLLGERIVQEEQKAKEDLGESILKEMHHAFLEALRQREQEIFSYLTTLGLAFGGFGWLLVQENSKEPPVTKTPFIFGSIGVLLLLCLGAVYAVALGYNYRYLTFQLAKIEDFLNIKSVMLKGWPRSVEEFEKYSRWCGPPEIIKVFWLAFTVGIFFVTWFAAKVSGMPVRIWLAGIALLLVGVLSPVYFASQFKRLWKKEPSWSQPTNSKAPQSEASSVPKQAL